MEAPLRQLLPSLEEATPELLLDRFVLYVRQKKIELYPAQEEAILELLSGKNVILNTPTGSGKTLVALSMQFASLARGRTSYYTTPIKALANEKFFSLCRDFGPDVVGMITGDAAVNPEAPIICCTAEILANVALRDGPRAKVDDVIMDEFHYYSDRDRGVAWQVPLITLPQCRFLLLSATLGDTKIIADTISKKTGIETILVSSAERPVPLGAQYSETPLQEKVQSLVEAKLYPIYLVHFTQRECAEEAQNFMSIDICTREEKKAILAELEGVEFSSPYGKDLQKYVKHGMGLHHAGLLPKYRVFIERLAQKGLLKIIFGTDTLGVGINVPIRTVLLKKLCKFDGEKTKLLSVREFKQISGRAGRKGYDEQGLVVVQAPEHVIENMRNQMRAANDPKKLKKLIKRNPPEKGYVPWGRDTFDKLVNGQPEAFVSRFKVTHAMLLNVLSRQNEEGCQAMRDLIRDCHESDVAKKRLRKTAFQLFRSLVERKIVEFNPLRVNVDLQEDFSLNHALSLYLVDTLECIDKNDPEYALDVLTLVESILENPEVVLRRQLDLIKDKKMQEMKLDGVEYDERIAELEKLEYPKPNRDFIYDTFNEFAKNHPWLGKENIRPKSVAREIYDGYYSFADYIRHYGLQRSEGILLRYLSDVYKTLRQNIPQVQTHDELFAMTLYFGALVREVDSSLIDEWENMMNPAVHIRQRQAIPTEVQPARPRIDPRTLKIMIMNSMARAVKLLSTGKYEALIEQFPPAHNSPKTAEECQLLITRYKESGHEKICIDQKARAPQNTIVTEGRVEQILVDPEGHNDWSMMFEIDIEATQSKGICVLTWTALGPMEDRLS